MYKLLPFIVLLICFDASAQIKLLNPSFEGTPQDATTPTGWTACGDYSTPDILPGVWGVSRDPYDGESFMGLIAREDNTWEYVGQRLSKPLKRGECYRFSLHLARSLAYVGYTGSLRFRIWGGRSSCHKEELLAETIPVKHNGWKLYNLKFSPQRMSYSHVIMEVHYKPGSVPYRGNLLIDNCSNITQCKRASLNSKPVEKTDLTFLSKLLLGFCQTPSLIPSLLF